MHLQSTVSLINAQYVVEISVPTYVTNPFTAAEREALEQFGSVSVSLGGTIPHGEGSFDLPANDVMFPDQFPVKETFDTEDDDDAGEKAKSWRDEVRSRIETAMEELRGRVVASGIGTQIDVIDTTPAPP